MGKFCSEVEYDGVDAVRAEYPAAADVVEVDGGWMVFETHDEFDTWSRQA